MHEDFISTIVQNQWSKFRKLINALMFLKTLKGLELTGSRYFGTEHLMSDYDFFVSAASVDEDIVRELVFLGFVREWNSHYDDTDPSVKAVYRLHGTISIDLQVIYIDWYDKKVAAQAKIKDLFDIVPEIMNRLSKESMKGVWQKFLGV